MRCKGSLFFPFYISRIRPMREKGGKRKTKGKKRRGRRGKKKRGV